MMYKWEVPVMTAVIYARYSSDNQREESIEGQIREYTAYAEKNGITIVKHNRKSRKQSNTKTVYLRYAIQRCCKRLKKLDCDGCCGSVNST